MTIFLYTMLFLIGVIVGNFWKNAIYRIPRNISLKQKGISYIEPNNNSEKKSKLFYIILGGVLSVIFGKILKININSLNFTSILVYIFTILYITVLIIIAGIDQKNLRIEKGVLAGGIILSIFYIMYLYGIDPTSINMSIIYLGMYIILLAIDTFIIKRYAENSYTIGILMLFDIIFMFTGADVFIYTLIITAIEILVYLLIEKIKQKKNGNRKIKLNDIPVGYFVSVSNIFAMIILSIITK